jgi:hypothetical protein
MEVAIPFFIAISQQKKQVIIYRKQALGCITARRAPFQLARGVFQYTKPSRLHMPWLRGGKVDRR